jgi:nucleoside-diphosphate-sugar epimerase
MKCVVTGAAGFIGSHLCEQLLDEEHEVVGLDCFVPYYPRPIKEGNLAAAKRQQRFRFAELDLRTDALDEAVAGAEVIFHLAAMAGLNQSWVDLELYSSCNLLATQRLLEAARKLPSLARLVHISTSSVYGRYACGDETMPTRPISPYGVTKLAAENLCKAYSDAFSVPVVVLRYFSVYGPRQRPDMGYHRFIEAMLDYREITVTGDGHQSRSNTYVADCVAATIAAIKAPPGEIYNIGGGESASVWDILHLLEGLAGRKARTVQAGARAGDQRNTFADTAKLQAHLGWQPRTRLADGLTKQWRWQQELRKPNEPRTK